MEVFYHYFTLLLVMKKKVIFEEFSDYLIYKNGR